MIIMLCIIWYLSGVVGSCCMSYFDWKVHSCDVTLQTILMCVLGGIGGPVMLFGAAVYTSNGIILIKGKGKK